MNIIINKNDVLDTDFSKIMQYFYYSGNSDAWQVDVNVHETQPYKLYANISNQVNDTLILDIGTKNGNSAIALSNNESNNVISYDLIQWPCHTNLNKSNIDLRIGNFMEDSSIDYDKVSIILIDVDPHDGRQEPPMIKFLEEKGWSGIILMDDIDYDTFPDLKTMFSNIPYKKYIFKDVGHFSGTGVFAMGEKYSLEVID